MESDVDIAALSGVYQEVAELIGVDQMMLLYDTWRGIQVSFPTHLYDSDKVRALVKRNQDELSSGQLARKYGFSQRWVANARKDTANNE